MKDSRKLPLSAGTAFALAIILITSTAVTAAHAQTFTVLYNFGGVLGDPEAPNYGPIAQGRDGNLYATSYWGGSTNNGTVFKITPTGLLTVVSNLSGKIGIHPLGGLFLGQQGYFYGTTSEGAHRGAGGAVFQMTADGRPSVLYPFPDCYGCGPAAPPTPGADGNLYGTVPGINDLFGSIYRVSGHGFTTLYEFTDQADGAWPVAPLLEATDGNFYGTESTAFKISPTGVFTTLGPLPGYSYAPLIQARNGYFYGVTYNGGTTNQGTVFEMSRAGKIRTLHSFHSGGDGFGPAAGLLEASDGNLYGVTFTGGAGWGTIYRVDPRGDFSVLITFSSDEKMGTDPLTTLVQHTNGILYGATSYGGAHGYGTFYSLDIGAPPFARLVTTFGKVGQTIGILGQGFTGATDVSFNGIPATFTVSSDTYLEATVPAGATTGFATVTTSIGTLTSNQQIQIRQ